MIIAETKRLVLQSFHEINVEEYFNIISDPEIKKYVPYASAYSLETANQYILAYCEGDFENDFYIVFKDKEHSKIIGAILAVKMSPAVLDISYLIHPNYRNMGFMKEALGAFITYISENTNYSSLRFTIENENLISQNVVKSYGATRYRILSKSIIWQIKLNDPLEIL